MLMIVAAPALAQACTATIDLAKGGLIFSGRLEFHVYAGPPGYEDVRKGDQPEPTYIVRLDDPVCVIHGEDDPGNVDRVQVYSDDKALMERLRASVQNHVTVTASEAFVGMTGHHHAPLTASIRAIDADAEGLPGLDAPGATTVRGFYEALEAGNGDEAASFVIPEKRRSGPLSGPAISRFYGTLFKPLRLRGVRPIGSGQFEVSYTYVARSGSCNGRSVVALAQRGELFLVSGIRSLSGC